MAIWWAQDDLISSLQLVCKDCGKIAFDKHWTSMEHLKWMSNHWDGRTPCCGNHMPVTQCRWRCSSYIELESDNSGQLDYKKHKTFTYLQDRLCQAKGGCCILMYFEHNLVLFCIPCRILPEWAFCTVCQIRLPNSARGCCRSKFSWSWQLTRNQRDADIYIYI